MGIPYKTQPPRAFWETAVSMLNPLELKNFYTKKFDISSSYIATAGSCFAQHIGRNIKEKGFKFLDVEPASKLFPEDLHTQYSYGIYSARYGNIYTVRQLLQLFQRAFNEFSPVEKFWTKGDGFVDPYRPTIEPNPFISVEEVLEQQAEHLENVKTMFATCGVFIFTMGLTESWENALDGAVFPVVPGTRAGGEFDDKKYRFHNFAYPSIINDLELFWSKLQSVNSKCKMILTVSPVPLVATAMPQHVAVATMYSKSVLRAVAGDFASLHDNVDYFPSFEIISLPSTRGIYFMPDGRSISSFGVSQVMKSFFEVHTPSGSLVESNGNAVITTSNDNNFADPLCDEEILKTLMEFNHE